MAHSSAPDRHHEPDSTHRPGTRLPATVSALRDADRGTRLGVGTRVLTAVVAAPLRIVRRLGQISRAAVHLVARGAAWIARTAATLVRPHGMVLSRLVHRIALTIMWCARSLRTLLGPTATFIARLLRGSARVLAKVVAACGRGARSHGRAGRTGRAVDRRGSALVRCACCTPSTWRSRGPARSTHSASTTQPVSRTRPRCMLASAVCPARSRSSRTPTCPGPGQPSMSSSR